MSRAGAITITIANGNGGGLVGRNQGDIKAAYTRDVSVDGGGGGGFTAAGGLTGNNSTGGHIIASYAAEVSVSNAGMNVGRLTGLVFSTSSRITASYCDSTTSTACIGAYSGGASSSTLIALAAAYPAAELKSEVDYTGIYSDWNVSVDGDTFPDNPWSFGTTTYPTLKTPAQRQAAAVMDYDADNDNLIDVDSLYQLNAIRHDLNGDGLPGAVGNYAAYAGAFPDGNIADTSTPYMGCPQTCAGYELTRNLDFDTDGDGQVGGVATSTDPYPNWPPIGGSYAATFDGNGHTISRLTITGNVRAGLFDTLAAAGVIRDVGMIDASVRAAPPVGQYIGVLTASNGGTITASYAAGPVAGPGPATRVGAFVGTLSSPAAAITDSNCDTSVHATPRPCVAVHISGANSGVTAAGYTAAQLQAPTGYTNMYRNWNLDLDGDTFPDYPWDFGTTTTYPTLYTPSERQTAAAQVMDYDQDDDNLIDITNLHQLNALRYDPDGNGLPDNPAHYSAYTGGFPNGNIADTGTPYMGCAATCIGYELTGNLESAAAVYPVWTPIASYQATLDGKGFYIAGLAISGDHANAGLFAVLTGDAVIRDLGLKTPTISSRGASANAGALAGDNAGRITASYVEGGSVTVTGATPVAGGLIGENTGEILAVWSTAAVTASTTATSTAGGLIGQHSGELTASYAAGSVTGSATSTVGGLIGDASAAVTASYCDTQATTQTNCIGSATVGAVAPGKTTSELQTPTGYTGIYESWNIDLDGDSNNDYPWNFGESTQYPTLNTPTERQARIEAGEDTLPPPLPRTIPPEPEREYDPAADHPEIYANAEYGMEATCRTHDVDPEAGNPRAATVTFDLGSYTGPILLHLSIWANGRYMAYETQGIALPALERDGQRATLRVDTDPAQTRFRLDGRRNGLAANLVLGYANCHNDES